MAKNRIDKNKKKQKNGSAPMDLTSNQDVTNGVQVMDTSEFSISRQHVSASHSKVKGVQMKRSKNVRKTKAIAKAISKNEIKAESILKRESKASRVQSAKNLYD